MCIRSNLADYLTKILDPRGYSFTTSTKREIILEIKEKLTYVTENFEAEMTKAGTSSDIQKIYKLLDTQVIVFGNEPFRFFEFLFKLSLTYDNIIKCDADIGVIYIQIQHNHVIRQCFLPLLFDVMTLILVL